jgi:hypothetical protein
LWFRHSLAGKQYLFERVFTSLDRGQRQPSEKLYQIIMEEFLRRMEKRRQLLN